MTDPMGRFMLRCNRTLGQPRGWYCKREQHPYTTPCALVPRWWNLLGKYTMWGGRIR